MPQKPLARGLVVGLHPAAGHPRLDRAHNGGQLRHGNGTIFHGNDLMAAAAVKAQLRLPPAAAYGQSRFVAAVPRVFLTQHRRHLFRQKLQPGDAVQAVPHLPALGFQRGLVGHMLAAATAAFVVHRAARLGPTGRRLRYLHQPSEGIVGHGLDNLHLRRLSRQNPGHEHSHALIRANALQFAAQPGAGKGQPLIFLQSPVHSIFPPAPTFPGVFSPDTKIRLSAEAGRVRRRSAGKPEHVSAGFPPAANQNPV